MLVAGLTFGLIFAAAILGYIAQGFIPRHHFSNESKDAAKLGAGLVATLTALVLGLLISSTKTTFDQVNDLLNQTAANYIRLDRFLANYGPVAAPLRQELRDDLLANLQNIWPEEFPGQTLLSYGTASRFEPMAAEIIALKPATPLQSWLQTRSLDVVDDLIHERYLVEAVGEGSVPSLLLILPVVWVSFLTFLYALFSPRNFTTVAVLLVCSLSVACAIFLIDEMAGPLSGTIKVPSAPLHLALDELGK